MSQLLKPSRLRKILSSLNEMLQEFSEKNKEISDDYTNKKNELKSRYTSEKKIITDENQKKLAALEEDFLKEKKLIDVEKEQSALSLQEAIDIERKSINQNFDESSETARRHSREYILEKRKENEESIKNQSAEHASMQSILDEALADCVEIKKLLKTFKEIQDSKDLISETFSDEEDGPTLEEQMRDCDVSPHFDRLEELRNESRANS